MPQKLIRLTTPDENVSGNCIFTGLFNEDLEIKENSEIALQSLSVERKSQEIRIKNSNSEIKFASVNATAALPSSSNQSGNIRPLETYNKSNDVELLNGITNALNSVCSMIDVPAQMNIQHKCFLNNAGKVQIEARASPFYTLDKGHPEPGSTDPAPSFPSFAEPDYSVINAVPNAEAVQTGVGDGAQGIFRETDSVITPDNPSEAYLFGQKPMIKSTGALRVRLKRLLANGGQVSAYIGLVKGSVGLSKLRESTLTEADMEYAIRVNGHNNAMDFKIFAGGSFSSTVTPINHTVAGAEYNDVLEIVIENGKIRGQIHQNNAVGGTGTDIRTQLATANVQDGEDYYWFISMVEGKDKIVFDLCGVSVDPFFGSDARTDAENQAISPNTTVLTTVTEYNRDTPLTPIFRINSAVASFLGWPDAYLFGGNVPFALKDAQLVPKAQAFDGNAGLEYALTLGYLWVAPEPYDNKYEADNYIIDTQSFLLDSYDSYGLSAQERNAQSGGSRRNILATVPMSEEPVPGTANGVIQYQPNTLNFIKIRNRSDVITRQLRFRLLTGRYADVQIQNMAAMTLLIRDPDGYKEDE